MKHTIDRILKNNKSVPAFKTLMFEYENIFHHSPGRFWGFGGFLLILC